MKKYHIKLSASERSELAAIAKKQKVNAQKKLRAQVLLACDEGEGGPSKTDLTITKELPVSLRTVEHLRERACEDGPIAALLPRPSSRVYLRKLDGRAEARLITIAKEAPPVGRATWTMQLLADRLVELKIVESIDDNTVHRTLKKTNLNLTSVGIG
jgi:transposase